MPTTQPLPPKKEVALALLERSNDTGIYVHLDPRQNGVVVPPWFKKQPQLVLQIGLNMPIPIPDLRLDDDGMSCTLSFNRSPFYCVVPWASVFAIVGADARGMVWPDDVPAEISRQAKIRPVDATRKETPKAATSARRADASKSPKAKRSPKRAQLSAVDGADGGRPDGRTGDGAPAPQASAKPAPAEHRALPALPPPPAPSAPASKPAVGAGPAPRKMRELPPYLRVVK